MTVNQAVRHASSPVEHFDLDKILYENIRNIRGSGIRDLLSLTESSDVISLAGGFPDPDLFPFEDISNAYERVMRDRNLLARSLQYSSTEGYIPLRDWIMHYMRSIGVDAARGNIMVTSGSQQALDLCARMFLRSGDDVAVDAPTYLGALQAFAIHGPSYTKLDRHIRSSTRLAYLVPDYSNPTGRTWAAAEREEVIESLHRTSAVLIEDAAYHSLGFQQSMNPPLQALDSRVNGLQNVRTIFCGSFSKTYIPSFRLGWICAPAPVIEKLTMIKQGCDLNSSAFAQILLLDLLIDRYDERMNTLRRHYRQRRDLMLAALTAHMPPGVQWTIPEGGFFVWLTLPEHLDSDVLLKDAIRAGVGYVPGRAFYAIEEKSNNLRLSYSSANLGEIVEGIKRLGSLLREWSAPDWIS